jgi:hypothetical protein
MATTSLRVLAAQWFPVLEGNATFVYRADVDPDNPRQASEREPYPDEISAYVTQADQNAQRLRAAGIETAETA